MGSYKNSPKEWLAISSSISLAELVSVVAACSCCRRALFVAGINVGGVVKLDRFPLCSTVGASEVLAVELPIVPLLDALGIGGGENVPLAVWMKGSTCLFQAARKPALSPLPWKRRLRLLSSQLKACRESCLGLSSIANLTCECKYTCHIT